MAIGLSNWVLRQLVL